MWVIHGLLAGSWRPGKLRIAIPIITLAAFSILQSIAWTRTDEAGVNVLRALSADPAESWTFALRLSGLTVAYLLFKRFTTTAQRLGVVVHVIIGLAVACAVFGIARQTLQHADGFVLPRLKMSSGFAQFINKDHFCYLMEMAFGLMAGVSFMRGGRSERIPFYLSGIILIWAALVLSKSRGGLLAMSIQMVFAALLFVNSRKQRIEPRPRSTALRRALVNACAGAILLIAVAAGVAWLGGDQLATGAETASAELAGTDPSELHEAGRRRDIWHASWRMFRQHPLAGAGLGGFWAEVPAFHEGSGVLTPQQAHNDYLEVLSSGGLIGAAILIWFVVVLIKQSRRIVLATDGFQCAVCLGAIISLAGIAVHSFVDFGLHIIVNALVAVVLLAILSLEPFAEKAEAMAE